jgi:PAS domain S-box-containing protein
VSSVYPFGELDRKEALAHEPDDLLLRTRARHLAFLEHAHDAIFIKDSRGRYTEVNCRFANHVGKPRSEIIGATDEDLFGPELGRRFREQDEITRRTGRLHVFEDVLARPDGRHYFVTRKFALPNGEVAGLIADVTRRTAERLAHERLADRLQVAMEATGLGFYENNLTTGESIWSDSAFKLLGLEPNQDLKGSYALWRTRVHPDDLERAEREHDAGRERGGPWSIQYRVIHPNGEVRWVSAYTQFTERPDGVYSTGIAVDITEQKRLEQQQRLLVSELNHRVKNLLAVVQSISLQTFRPGGDPQEQRSAFESRLVALARVHGLIHGEVLQPVNIRKVVAQAIRPFQQIDRRSIRFGGPDFDLDGSKCVPLALAIHELCTNAVKYGSLSVPCGRVDIQWSQEPGSFHFEWREEGGPRVSEPQTSGFGKRMLERALSRELGTAIRLEFDPEGVRYRFTAPL